MGPGCRLWRMAWRPWCAAAPAEATHKVSVSRLEDGHLDIVQLQEDSREEGVSLAPRWLGVACRFRLWVDGSRTCEK
jgi:hypothetical protein